MIWLMLGIGLVVGFILGIWGTRHFEVAPERTKALDAITALINARELFERPPPPVSISYAGNQQWDFVVVVGKGASDGSEA